MSKGGSAGTGREIFFAKGLAGWLFWLNLTDDAGAEGLAHRRVLEKYELQNTANEIVILIANIIQEAI